MGSSLVKVDFRWVFFLGLFVEWKEEGRVYVDRRGLEYTIIVVVLIYADIPIYLDFLRASIHVQKSCEICNQ